MSDCEEVRDPGTPPDHAFARFSFDLMCENAGAGKGSPDDSAGELMKRFLRGRDPVDAVAGMRRRFHR
jgi:hypothetical protein